MIQLPTFRKFPLWAGLLSAVALVAATLLLRLAFGPSPTLQPVLIFFVIPIILSAFLGGAAAGMTATVLSAVLSDYFLLPPFGLGLEHFGNSLQLIALISIGATVSVVVEALYRSRGRVIANMELLATTLSSIGDAVIVTDLQGRVTFLNPEAERMTGWPTGDAIGKPLPAVFRIISEDSQEEAENPVDKALRDGMVVELANHTVLVARDGRQIPIDDSAAPICSDDGPIHGVVLVFRDITERRQTEERTRHLASFPQLNPDPVIEVDASGKITFANPATLRVLSTIGLGKEDTSVFLPPDLDIVMADLARQGDASLYREIFVGDRVFGESVYLVPHSNDARIYARDITRGKRAEDALRQSESRHRELVQSANSAIVRWKGDGTITFFNKYALDFFGYREEEVLGRQVSILLPAADSVGGDSTGLVGDIVARPGHYVNNVNENICRDGRRVWMAWTNKPIYGADGELAEVLAIGADITAQKLNEDALKAAAERYRMYINVTGQLGWTTNAEGDVVEDLPSWTAYTGMSQQQIRGRGWLEAIHPDDREHVVCKWQEAVAAAKDYEVEYRIRRHDGVYRHFLARGIPVPAEDGGVREWVGTCVDISERRRAEEQLRRSREDLNHAQEVGNIGSWRLDVRTNELTWSDENHRIFGIPQGTAMTYETFLSAVHPDDLGFVDKRWKAALKGEPYDIEHRILAGGLTKWVREKAYLEFDEDGALLGGFGITQDITKRRQADEEILKLSEDMAARNVELEDANRDLESFIYSVSHDLRAPLRSISGFANIVIKEYFGKFDAQGRDYLGRIVRGADKMNRLIDALLHLSRISRQDVARTRVDLSTMAESIISGLREAQPGREVGVEIGQGIAAMADPRLMELALSNLLDNAWKFTAKTEGARIEFGTTTGEGDNIGRISHIGPIFFVKDNGVGFDSSYAEKMFLPFHRLHADSEYEGAGIGLSIVERVIRRHGGKIWAEGSPGKGAVVYFTLG